MLLILDANKMKKINITKKLKKSALIAAAAILPLVLPLNAKAANLENTLYEYNAEKSTGDYKSNTSTNTQTNTIEEENIKSKKKFSTYLLSNYSNPILNKGFCDNLSNQLSANIIDWNLRPEWQPIQPAKTLSLLGIGLDAKIYKNLSLTGNLATAGLNSNYSQTYTFTDPDYGDYFEQLSREEKNWLLNLSLGLKIKKELSDRLKLEFPIVAEIYYLHGRANLEKEIGPSGGSAIFTQSKNAAYSGLGGGCSIGVCGDYSVSKNIDVVVGMKYRLASVQTAGTEITTSSSATNPVEEPCSIPYSLNGLSAVVQINWNTNFDFKK